VQQAVLLVSAINHLLTIFQCDTFHYNVQYTHLHIDMHILNNLPIAVMQMILYPGVQKGNYSQHFHIIAWVEVHIVL